MGPCRNGILSYLEDTTDDYSKESLCALAANGDRLIDQCGGVYPALVEFQENQMRLHNEQLNFASGHRDLSPVQYPEVVNILDQGVRAVYNRGAAIAPRVRGLPYKKSPTEMIAGKFRKDIRARRLFACSANCISQDAPIEATPTATVEKKKPDRTVSTDRRAIADMRRINVGSEVSQYYPAKLPSIESIARLVVSLTVSLPGFEIEMTKRDFSSFRLLRLRPSLSLLMCTELPVCVLGRSHDVVAFYLAIPFGRIG